jgi:hypothetical protein
MRSLGAAWNDTRVWGGAVGCVNVRSHRECPNLQRHDLLRSVARADDVAQVLEHATYAWEGGGGESVCTTYTHTHLR